MGVARTVLLAAGVDLVAFVLANRGSVAVFTGIFTVALLSVALGNAGATVLTPDELATIVNGRVIVAIFRTSR